MNTKKQKTRNDVICLNPWDVQSKHVFDINGICETLYAGECRWGGVSTMCATRQKGIWTKMLILNDMGGDVMSVSENVTCTLRSQMKHHEPIVCYAIEGNVVDRVSAKNGKGWCEDVSPTLNTQDRHAICFQLCGDRDDPSVSVSDIAYCIPANPMSDRGQAVCIALEGNGARPSHMGKGFSTDGTMYTLNTIEQHSVCYSVDCRNLAINRETSATLQAKNNGGFSYNYLPPILKENE